MQDSLADRRAVQLKDALRGVFSISQANTLAAPVSGVEFVGHLLSDPESAYPVIRERFAALGYTAFLSQEGQVQVVRALESEAQFQPAQWEGSPPHETVQPQAQHPQRFWVNLVLFLLTVVSTLITGALYEGADPLSNPASLLRGIPFSFTVIAILGTHEMGHYIVARQHKAAVSLPYFVPLPYSLFGTMGAVIVQRSPFEDRKSLFDVGIAGPLAGLIVAIPLLVIGLAASPVEPYTVGEGFIFEGNSLFYLGMKYLIHGRLLPASGLDVQLSSMAFAAWFGLLVTFFNLIPIGQLDGGHVLYALIGRRAWPIARLLSQLLLVVGGLGLAGQFLAIPLLAQNFWPGWFIWGLLTTWMRPQHPPPLNDLSRLGPSRRALGIFTILLFFSLFTRVPLSFTPVLF